MNLSLPSLRLACANTEAAYELTRRTYLDDPTDEHRHTCARAAQRWADAQDALGAAVEGERRHQAAAALG